MKLNLWILEQVLNLNSILDSEHKSEVKLKVIVFLNDYQYQNEQHTHFDHYSKQPWQRPTHDVMEDQRSETDPVDSAR